MMQPLIRAHQARDERLQRGGPLHMKHSKSNTTGIALIGCSMSSRKYLAVSSAFDELKDIFCRTRKLQSAEQSARIIMEHAHRNVTTNVT